MQRVFGKENWSQASLHFRHAGVGLRALERKKCAGARPIFGALNKI